MRKDTIVTVFGLQVLATLARLVRRGGAGQSVTVHPLAAPEGHYDEGVIDQDEQKEDGVVGAVVDWRQLHYDP